MGWFNHQLVNIWEVKKNPSKSMGVKLPTSDQWTLVLLLYLRDDTAASYIYIWMFPKIVGEIPPNHPIFNRVFHYFHHPFWGTPFLETPIYYYTNLMDPIGFKIHLFLPRRIRKKILPRVIAWPRESWSFSWLSCLFD